jgi:beta-glucosidase
VQTELMKALKTTGKPVVFVMMTGSALAIPYEAENIPAIVNAWYGGQSAGTAIADVLFGDYNPAGRLPVTFYRADSDLPDFNDYSMDNRTYRYFNGQPLYGFGYGLSYTTFKYDQLKVPVSVSKARSIPVSVRVTNTGSKDGDEVVQMYVSYPASNNKVPLKALIGFKRIFLKVGESKVVPFVIKPENISIADSKGVPNQVSGKILLSVGGSQPDAKTNANGKTVKATLKVN